MTWTAGGVFDSPSDGDIVLDYVAHYGMDPTFPVSMKLIVSASTHCMLLFQHRNADNDETIREQLIAVQGWKTEVISISDNAFASQLIMGTNERLRAVVRGDVLGTVSISLWHSAEP